MNTPPIVSAQEWEAARQQLLVKEKEVTRSRDVLAASRRRMPWLPVDKHYEFDGPEGRVSLLDLFDKTERQLIGLPRLFRTWRARMALSMPAAAAPWWPTTPATSPT